MVTNDDVVMETRAKKFKRDGEGWTCPVEHCTMVSMLMPSLCCHLKKKHNWSVLECKAFRRSIGVKSNARWDSMPLKTRKKTPPKLSSLPPLTATSQNTNTVDESKLTDGDVSTEEMSSSKFKYICPMSMCEREFSHRHTVQAHIEFRHNKRPEEAMEIASSAMEIINEAEPENDLGKIEEKLQSQGWFPIVDDFLHEDILLDTNTPQAIRENLSEHVFETVKYLYPDTTPLIDFKMAAAYIDENWVSNETQLLENYEMNNANAASIFDQDHVFGNTVQPMSTSFYDDNIDYPVDVPMRETSDQLIQTVGPLDPPDNDNEYEIFATNNYVPHEDYTANISQPITQFRNGIVVRSVGSESDSSVADASAGAKANEVVKKLPKKSSSKVYKSSSVKQTSKKVSYSNPNKAKK